MRILRHRGERSCQGHTFSSWPWHMIFVSFIGLALYLIVTAINGNQSHLPLEGSDGNSEHYKSKAKGSEPSSTCCSLKTLSLWSPLLLQGEVSKGAWVFHVLASREPSLYFEVFRRLGGKIEKRCASSLCVQCLMFHQFQLKSRTQSSAHALGTVF